MIRLFPFPDAVERDAAVEAWLDAHPGELGALARRWFGELRACGADVRELMHDGQATACVGGAAFAYVAVYTSHVSVGFYVGSAMADPHRLLEGSGKFMRHVKLRSGAEVEGLPALIHTAYTLVKAPPLTAGPDAGPGLRP